METFLHDLPYNTYTDIIVLFFDNLKGGTMTGEELVTFITALSIAIAKDKTIDELSLTAAIFTQLGDTLATIAARRQCLEANADANNDADSKDCNHPYPPSCPPPCDAHRRPDCGDY